MEPEAASVGLAEGQAKGIDYKVSKFPMAANGKSLILNVGEGLVKIIAGKKCGEVLGMYIIGPRATDLITEGALAIGVEATLNELIATIHSHPTVTETMREAGPSTWFHTTEKQTELKDRPSISSMHDGPAFRDLYQGTRSGSSVFSFR